jgi:hypothetical protein
MIMDGSADVLVGICMVNLFGYKKTLPTGTSALPG